MTSTCNVCRLSLSDQDVPSHLNGKKHLKNAVRIQRYGGLPKGEPIVRKTPVNSFEKNQASVSKPKQQPATQPGPTRVKKQQGLVKKEGNSPAYIFPELYSGIFGHSPFSFLQTHLIEQAIAQPKRKREEKQVDAKTDIPNVIISKLRRFPQQLNDFLEQIEQTEIQRKKIQEVLNDVAFTFSKALPNVIPVLYGSNLSGLAFRTSDIDVYLCNPTAQDEDRDFIKKHGRIIWRTHLFTNIVLVTRARVPIIKAKHISTGIELDISATSGQAVANSLLLRFILSYDPRVSKIMMLIGYWGKKCGLITRSRFSRYSINLLIIFYLQNLPEPILPPLSMLVLGVPGKTWPFRIYEDESLLKNNNYVPLHILFMGFFEFYVNFMYSEFVISTYLGRTIPFKDMELPEVLDQMVYYKTYLSCEGEKLLQREICIQDPLELSHNTSKAVTPKTLHDFKFCCKKMIEMKEKLNIDEWLYEMVHGDVAKPVPEKGGHGTFRMEICYDTSTSWIDDFQKDFLRVLGIIGIRHVGKVPDTDESKKAKLNPNCLSFSLETTTLPFSQENGKLLTLLKSGSVTFEHFSKNFTLVKDQKEPNKFNFSAQCFVSAPKKPNTLRLQFTNTGEPSSFMTLLSNLRRYLQILINAFKPPPVQTTKPEQKTEIKETDKSKKESEHQ